MFIHYIHVISPVEDIATEKLAKKKKNIRIELKITFYEEKNW